jgi:RNA-directed DNA polymerase
MNHPPKKPQLLQGEIESDEGGLFAWARRQESGLQSPLHGIQGEAHDAVRERGAVGLGEVLAAVDGPGEEFMQQGEDRRARGHKKRRAPFTLDDVASMENLRLAARKARRGKSRKPDVEDFWLNEESHLHRLHEELSTGAWMPGGYHTFKIFEPKQRVISAAPFADRVVHHALCNLMQPVLERRFIARSFSCQVGKGTTAARDCVRKLVSSHRHVLKCDVRKFFDSIDHEVLLAKLREALPNKGVMGLCERIIASHHTQERARRCGLPIGNLTSQLWGNFYLDGMDHLITEVERHGAYARYTDDFPLFSDDKKRLWGLRERIVEHLATLHLELALPKSQMMACREGVPFCGFRFYPGTRPRVLGATKRRFEVRRNRQMREGDDIRKISQGIVSWYQFSREGNVQGLLRAYTQWPAHGHRLRRRRGWNARVVRGGSWNNNDRDNLASSNRNNNTPDNRNNNNGFRCVVVVGRSSPKLGASKICQSPGGHVLPGPCQDAKLTHAPAP